MKTVEEQIIHIIEKSLQDYCDDNLPNKILSEVTIEIECPECKECKNEECFICSHTRTETITLKEAIERLK